MSDLSRIGLIEPDEVAGGFVRKLPHAYPVYDLTYKENLAPILEFVHRLQNIKTGGRQGLFRYNNMDQSIEMGRKMAWSLVGDQDAGHEAVATDARVLRLMSAPPSHGRGHAQCPMCGSERFDHRLRGAAVQRAAMRASAAWAGRRPGLAPRSWRDIYIDDSYWRSTIAEDARLSRLPRR